MLVRKASTSRRTWCQTLLVTLNLPTRTWSIPGDWCMDQPLPGGLRTMEQVCLHCTTAWARDFRSVCHWWLPFQLLRAVLRELQQHRLVLSSTATVASMFQKTVHPFQACSFLIPKMARYLAGTRISPT